MTTVSRWTVLLATSEYSRIAASTTQFREQSIDPGFGGPFYFFQNIYYDNVGGVGGCGYSCAGMLFYQNTIIDEVGGGGRNVHFLNNLIVAAGASTGNGHSYNPRPVVR